MRRHFHAALAFSVVAALAMGGLTRAQDVDKPQEARILLDKLPDYWIGVHAVPVDDALKSHLQLEDRLIVARVMPDSPAAKADLRQHDILLKFGDAKIVSHRELIAAVEAAEANETPVTVLRGGQEKTIPVTPTKRPDNIIDLPFPERGLALFPDLPNSYDKWWHKTRVVGPGFFLDRKLNEELPDGVEINIKKENDEPAKITVKRGEDKWEVTEETIDKLPEDLREHVKRHLQHQSDRDPALLRIYRGGNGEFNFDRLVPDNVPPRVNQAIRRLEQLQRRLDEDDPFKALQEQIEALRREVEKLREEKKPDDAKSDEARDA